MVVKSIPLGTIRVEAKSLKAFEKTTRSWKQSTQDFPELKRVVKLYKAQRQFKILKDTKDSRWLKGQLSRSGQAQGARINMLPTGEILEKAFSLFSPHLTLHDQDSHDHWDVLYQNKGGTYSYVYTKAKRQAHRNAKYKKVDLFGKYYPTLTRNLRKAIKEGKDPVAVALQTLLKTSMRVGNETYFKAHKHKGLTTLCKRDLVIKDNYVTFSYLSKGGVPVEQKVRFSHAYISALRNLLKGKKNSEYVFTKNGSTKTLKEIDFKKAFMRYCGHEFYPHIVRSYYASKEVSTFLVHKNKISKDEVEKLYRKIARRLGHKKFNKKTGHWEDHYAVSINSYVRPELIERINTRLGRG